MKNLLTLLFLVISVLAFGQSNSQSLEVEIKYWKSIAESNDTVAFRDYLQRYGEDGLYKDEAITRIALLKTSGKQEKSDNSKCCFYVKSQSLYNVKNEDNIYIIKMDCNHDTVCLRIIDYNTVRSNLAMSQDFYENDRWIVEKQYNKDEYRSFEEYFFNKPDPEDINAEEFKYNQIKSTSVRDVYFKRDTREQVKHEFAVPGKPGWYRPEPGDHGDYSRSYYFDTFHGYRYLAISKDKSSIIIWFEDDENLDGSIHEKENYYRVPKEELLPKAVNYDFLNE